MFLRTRPDRSKRSPHLIRVKAGQTLTTRIAGLPLRVHTHYFKSRTFPCIEGMATSCPLCQLLGDPRYYAYWPVVGSTGAQGAVELTDNAEFELIRNLPDHDSPIGHLVTFHRPSGRRNNPIEVSIPYTGANDDRPSKQHVEPIPVCDVQATLLRLWELPSRNAGESEIDYQNRLIVCCANRYNALLSAE